MFPGPCESCTVRGGTCYVHGPGSQLTLYVSRSLRELHCEGRHMLCSWTWVSAHTVCFQVPARAALWGEAHVMFMDLGFSSHCMFPGPCESCTVRGGTCYVHGPGSQLTLYVSRSLRELNCEGNQLPAMPSGALRLDLDRLNVKNNFMHPLFWHENTHNEPQVINKN